MLWGWSVVVADGVQEGVVLLFGEDVIFDLSPFTLQSMLAGSFDAEQNQPGVARVRALFEKTRSFEGTAQAELVPSAGMPRIAADIQSSMPAGERAVPGRLYRPQHVCQNVFAAER